MPTMEKKRRWVISVLSKHKTVPARTLMKAYMAGFDVKKETAVKALKEMVSLKVVKFDGENMSLK